MTQPEAPCEAWLAPYAARSATSRGRRFDEPEHPFRPRYQRDRDRIVHSTAFRRLEYKTQVFVNHEGDHYRTRLTHTLEVAQIGRTLARALSLNEDLVEAIALAHDLGHTPFGHSGEAALNRLMRDHGGFEHNMQGLRVVDLLERRYPDFAGLNLTYEVREAFLRHNTRHDRPAPDQGLFEEEGALLEVQITLLADEIAYDNHDIDDGLYAGILREEELRELSLLRAALAGWRDDLDGMAPDLRRCLLVRRLINFLVTDLLETSRGAIAAAGVETVADVRACRAPLIRLSPEVAAMKHELETHLMTRFYRHYRVMRMAKKAQRFLRELFTAYANDPIIMPHDYQDRIKEHGLHRTVCDYISGMTDRYAEDEYGKLFHPFRL